MAIATTATSGAEELQRRHAFVGEEAIADPLNAG